MPKMQLVISEDSSRSQYEYGDYRRQRANVYNPGTKVMIFYQ